jgi:hypothetical protein
MDANPDAGLQAALRCNKPPARLCSLRAHRPAVRVERQRHSERRPCLRAHTNEQLARAQHLPPEHADSAPPRCAFPLPVAWPVGGPSDAQALHDDGGPRNPGDAGMRARAAAGWGRDGMAITFFLALPPPAFSLAILGLYY